MSSEMRHKSLQIANSAALLLASRVMTAVGVPLMVFLANEVWTKVDTISANQHTLEVTITKMQGDINLVKFRVNEITEEVRGGK